MKLFRVEHPESCHLSFEKFETEEEAYEKWGGNDVYIEEVTYVQTKFGVVGNREGFSKEFIFKKLEEFVKKNDIIISGGAEGVDSFAREWAYEKRVLIIEYKPDKNTPSPQRYFNRNTKIAEECDWLIAFNKKQKSGTMNTIRTATKLKKPVSLFVSEGEK